MEIIDSHCHIWPEKVVDKAKSYLENLLGIKMITLPTASNLLKHMNESGISKSVVSSVASRPDQVLSINNWLFSLQQERFIVFASMHPFFKGFRKELKRIQDNAYGIKFQPEFQNFYFDDELIFYIYEEIEKLQIPLLVHCGVQLNSRKNSKSSPDRILKVLNKFSSLKIIGAHMGGFLMWEESLRLLAGKNIYFDTSDSVRFMKRDLLDEFFYKHGLEKIIFGSDFPLADSKKDIEFINSLNIIDEDKEKILSGNIKKILNI
ncbi:MAG: amidohydrolase family protein [Endomicrobium sp.]|jgi:predicted TIM-barrel fold metal-dependent hydrolase|uniref:amidohydrolase family protein n=1 Tax=Candidatus Endomicrobiellum cubanum TaxID=3242325 RepID=UPI002827D2FA|nr:amidohydrolase family protein [Endomicrobium sp.]